MSEEQPNPTVQAHASIMVACAMPLLALYELLIEKNLISKDEAIKAVSKYENNAQDDGQEYLRNSVMRTIKERLQQA